ncbi:MAG: cytochrome c peroxidase [Crocinitomicaceae bacterium]|nr:cytochrome c peroxidase [Crocinitomicaceae bacterium]MDG1777550.1 cytochrome c peroxidase [Crocinitomicaceae bacterium]
MKYIIYLGGIVLIPFFLYQFKQLKKCNIKQVPIISTADSIVSGKISLGRLLFFDKRLSVNNEISCASCHLPELAFTDGRKVSVGVLGRTTQRNSPTLLNAKALPTVMFDAHLPTLEQQVIVPIQEHVEMDMNMLDLIEKLKGIDVYNKSAKKLFNREFDAWVLTRSIAAYERSLISSNSSFDKYYYQYDEGALTESQKKGWDVFSTKLYCVKCHMPPNFTNFEAIDNGLYNDFGEDKGRFRIFNDSTDIGKFKVPSLRNIALTAPYMHDGSLSSITEVIDHYATGGKLHINKDKRIVPFNLSKNERTDLINFLSSLTDTSYMVEYR